MHGVFMIIKKLSEYYKQNSMFTFFINLASSKDLKMMLAGRVDGLRITNYQYLASCLR